MPTLQRGDGGHCQKIKGCPASLYKRVNLFFKSYLGSLLPPEPSMEHWVKSMGLPQDWHLCGLSNSSEKISFSAPHSGHLQVNALKFLNC
jgi:hypothetical protein